jgi:hypothetical protein
VNNGITFRYTTKIVQLDHTQYWRGSDKKLFDTSMFISGWNGKDDNQLIVKYILCDNQVAPFMEIL